MTNHTYAAGLFDGEGTVTMTRYKKNERRTPVASLSSTTYELVDFMRQQYGGQVITLTKRQNHHKQAWHWQVSRDGALAFLEHVRAYLREPDKKRRADMLVERYKTVTARNGKYTTELATARELFEEEFFNLQEDSQGTSSILRLDQSNASTFASLCIGK